MTSPLGKRCNIRGRYTECMKGLSPAELKILKRLNTPIKIQDFLDTLPTNFEHGGETCFSPRKVLRERKAHCMEGAMLAALALRVHGHKPWVLDLKVASSEDDHVVTPFTIKGYWGAISKTNHVLVRYRDPIYRTLRELVMSYFHEYTDTKGKKVLRWYSKPLDLSRFDSQGWMTSEEDVFYIPQYLDTIRHYPLITKSQDKLLRPADRMELKIGAMLEWKSERKRNV